MGLIDKLKRRAEGLLSESRLEEELMYKHILEEMKDGIVRDGLYAKALANSDGDEVRAKALYMKFRVQSIKDALNGQSYLEYYEKLLKSSSKTTRKPRGGKSKSQIESDRKNILKGMEKLRKKREERQRKINEKRAATIKKNNERGELVN